MRTLIYTFRGPSERTVRHTNPEPIFVFGKLKQDLDVFVDVIRTYKPDLIQGIACNKFLKYPVYETRSINRINSGLVTHGGPNEYLLYVPMAEHSRKQGTDSFCNWTSYKISEFLDKEGLLIPHSFMHIPKPNV